jgi:hypothetical protein
VDEIRRFETPSEIPLGFRENDSLDEFLARTTLGHYNHFRAVENQSEVARILGIHRNTLYLRVERARRILRSNLDGVELVGMNQAGRDSNQSVFID